MKQEFHISVQEENQSLVDLLANASTLSKQTIKQTMHKGAVWLENNKGTHRIRRADKMVKPNDIIHCYYDTDILNQTTLTPELIADEQDYSVWHKPAGMLSQGSKWGDHCTIHRWIESNHTFTDKVQRPCFIVHRLDKATQGLMLIAHKKTTATELCKLFENRQIKKKYYAIIEGEFPVKFNQHLNQEPVPKPILIESKIDEKLAKTFAQRLSYHQEKNQSLVDVTIETGRKHQIRIHLSDYGHPVVGDTLHGNSSNNDLQLQCYQLSFKLSTDTQEKTYTLANKLII